MFTLEAIQSARELIANHIHHTPFQHDVEAGLFLKWENHQVTGSFKIRGALAKVLTMKSAERGNGLVTASAGNHGQGVAFAGKITNTPVHVFASEHAVPIKVESMRSLGAQVHLVQGGYAEAETTGLRYAQDTGLAWVSAYNDSAVITGQGTLALEILEESPDTKKSTWYVPVGGGGLISGIAVVLRSLAPGARLIGVQSEASAYFHALFHQRRQEDVIETESLADGLAGAVEPGSVTIDLVNRLVDDILLVSEAEIVMAMKMAWQRYGEVIEGSGAVALAAAHRFDQSGKIALSGRSSQVSPAVVVVSGGNIQPDLHTMLIHSEENRTS